MWRLSRAHARLGTRTHLGQTFQVVSGVGLVGLRNELPSIKAEIPLDTPGGTLAWTDSWQQHGPLAIQEALGGRIAEWLEKVSDEDYSGLAE